MKLIHTFVYALRHAYSLMPRQHKKLGRKTYRVVFLTLSCFPLSAVNNTSSIAPFEITSIHTPLLCVLHDAGETALLPVLKNLESEGKDFRVLVMATAETLVKLGIFTNKRLVLADFGIQTCIDTTTPRTTTLSDEDLLKFGRIIPQIVLVGTSARIQQQILEQFPCAETVAFVDNFDYDPSFASFDTVEKVQAAANHVLCPSQNVVDLFTGRAQQTDSRPIYHVVGKPSLEILEKEIASVNKAHVLETLGLQPSKPVAAFIGGYGPGYDVVNPLFDACAERLQKEGIQVILQPHPKIAPQKVKITEVLAVSDYIVGYNSSVIFDSAVIGKNAVFFIPKEKGIQFNHFAIRNGLIAEVGNCEELCRYIGSGCRPKNISQIVQIPKNSIEIISNLMEKFMIQSSENERIVY